jgi:uncharacterized protein YjbJ (UPF0337 family)
MNRDQWRGALKQVRGSMKKQWGRLTGNSLLETMGELERLLGVFQRQYGHLRSQQCRAADCTHTSERSPEQKPRLRLIQGTRRSRVSHQRIRASSLPLQLS